MGRRAEEIMYSCSLGQGNIYNETMFANIFRIIRISIIVIANISETNDVPCTDAYLYNSRMYLIFFYCARKSLGMYVCVRAMACR